MEKIKELRDKTGAGMVDCKKALDEANGDLDQALDILRKKGIAKAAKRSDREASEGVIKVDTNNDKKKGYILEIKSETDFVAKNDKFQELATKILETAKNNNIEKLDDLLSFDLEGSSIEDHVSNLSGVIGEKIEIGRFESVEGESVSAYSHLGGKIGVLVSLDQPGKEDLAGDVAMHIAAANPKYLQSSEISPEELEREKGIYKEQLLKEGKPENIIDNIIAGKVKKYQSEICLLDQEYIKDDKKTISEILDGANINKFIRYSL
jgi:elongation factor Ts